MNIDLSHIENISEEIVKDRAHEMRIVQGEIVTSQFMDSICQEINESLQETGCTQISELVLRLSFPTDFVYEVRTPLEKKKTTLNFSFVV